MRALLAGELTQAQSYTSDYYVKLEVQNGSGTWIDVGAALGRKWIVNAAWGENVESKVAQYTFTLVQEMGGNSLSPFMAASVLNRDDAMAYAPLLNVGRLVRASSATMPHLTPLDVTKYRKFCDGRIDNVQQADSLNDLGPITIVCSDLGAWLMDMQIETSGRQFGTSPVGTPLETVIQNVLNANIPTGEPAVTLYKQSTSNFDVTDWTQGDTKVLDALNTLVLDSTGEDIRYRYDAAHASRLTWYNPDRTRVTVDATFAPGYTMRNLDIALADIRNAGEMPYVGGKVSAVDAASILNFRRRFFRLAGSTMITVEADAQKVIDAVVNDLSAPPGEAAADIPFFWPVQLWDRHTFQANGRQYDTDQTFAVMGYQHTIEHGRGSTTLTLTARIVGAFGEWLKRIAVKARDVELKDLTRTDSADGNESTFSFTLGADVDSVWASSLDIIAPQQSSDWDLVNAALAPLGTGVLSYTVTRPRDGHEVLGKLVPYDVAGNPGTMRPFEIAATPQVPHWEWDDNEDYATGIGTLWGEYTERGIRLSAIEFQTQVGSNPISDFLPPTRVAGAASVVRGGVLGARQVEMDVSMDVDRQSWIVPRETLETGAQRTPDGWFAFDRDKNPKLMGVTVSGTKITILGDVDTKSIKVDDLNSTWEYTIDGPFAVIDVALTGTNAVAGLGASASSTYTVTAYSARKAEVDGSTLFDSRNVVVGGATSTPAAAAIVDAIAVVPDVGNTNCRISIQVTSVIALWTIKLYIAESTDNPTIVPTSDFAAAVVPSAVTPTATMVSHVYSAAFTRVAGGVDTMTVYCNIRIDLCDGSGVVQDTRTINTGWETPA